MSEKLRYFVPKFFKALLSIKGFYIVPMRSFKMTVVRSFGNIYQKGYISCD